MINCWRKLPCSITELRIDITLACGQSFRWKEIEPGIWRSVLHGKVVTIKQTNTDIFYQIHGKETTAASDDVKGNKRKSSTSKKSQPRVKKVKKDNATLSGDNQCDSSMKMSEGKNDDEAESSSSSILLDYFQLDVNLQELYAKWAEADENFKKVALGFPGVRILRQDPVENLISFICSSNNNISRITGMVEKLCTNYGEKVCVIDGVQWNSFPTLSALSQKGVEVKLRTLGFGYRAKFINQTAKMICGELGGESWLYRLRTLPYEEAHSQLIRLPGVGAKVADCVCLMSLDKHGAIPVDTHVWQIACRDYMKTLQQTKSLTDRTYKEIGNFFRELFGHYAGWAHSVLFSADLKKFQKPSGDLSPKSKQISKKKNSTKSKAVKR